MSAVATVARALERAGEVPAPLLVHALAAEYILSDGERCDAETALGGRNSRFTDGMVDVMYKRHKPASIDDTITCKFCHQQTCYRFQQQVRSGDEGATAFVMCTKCNKRYKE